MSECVDYSTAEVRDTPPPRIDGKRTLRDIVMYPVPAKAVGAIVTLVAVAMSLFHLYTGCFGVLTALIQRSVHLSFVMVLVFLTVSARRGISCIKNRVPLYDLVLAALAVLPGLYLALHYEEIANLGGQATTFGIVLGCITTLLLLETVRRVVGLPLVLICVAALLYAYFGRSLPGILEHRGYSIARISYQMYQTQSGIMGVPLGVCATVIALFILFGTFLDKSGGSKYFVDFAQLLTARSCGGPAKAAVVASGLMGTISGSTVANVVTTGNLTIPLMIKTGYDRAFAAAVEAVASSGGQIAPPIMGAAAFLMAEMTGIPYVDIAISASIPALLFYVSLFCMVHFEAKRLCIKPMDTASLPRKSKVFEGVHLFLPLIALIYLLMKNYSPMYVGFWTIVGTILISYARKVTWLTPAKILACLKAGALNMMPVTAACACAGIVIGAVTVTGLPLKLSVLLIDLAGGSQFMLLVLTMVASLVLGMGLPTAPAYILLATLVAPALVQTGVPVVAAHMFIFYYGIISAVTPPVALAAYAAAGISGSDPNKVGFKACFIGIATYIVPFMFVYGPALVNIGTAWQVLLSTATAITGIVALAVAVVGHGKGPCPLWQRLLFLISSLMLVYPEGLTDLAGLALLAGTTAVHILGVKRSVNNVAVVVNSESN
jgi:TRAP transporter 4TM/12TM fusion protein